MAFDARAYARQMARKYRLQVGIFLGLIQAESGWDASAGSSAGAYGYTQLMPDTAAGLGVNRSDPRGNIEGGAKYLRQQLDTFRSYPLALAAYNAGPGAVRQHGGIPPYAETRTYVQRVLANARKIGDTGGSAGGGGIASTDRIIEVLGPASRPSDHSDHVHVAGESKSGNKQSPTRAWVRAEASKAGLRHTSGDRSSSANSGVGGAQGSNHLSTNRSRWADDFGGSPQTMRAFEARMQSLKGTVPDGVGAGGGGLMTVGLRDLDPRNIGNELQKVAEFVMENLMFLVILLAALLLGGALITYGAIRATGQQDTAKGAAKGAAAGAGGGPAAAAAGAGVGAAKGAKQSAKGAKK